eukprot:CAMPEP_0119557714 /NCGR_PEP_ID=MMETSP1352-20130426/9290_1 /TAXON_ID=265584 /ORGANISM="Stauroneis constricta, Strain CCMP1120" /LENGTH=1625 /DNA_ID=CAMNT_0007604855 /DNA_START=168 /DNA_END=5045 /DNA_ORIENTATION=+
MAMHSGMDADAANEGKSGLMPSISAPSSLAAGAEPRRGPPTSIVSSRAKERSDEAQAQMQTKTQTRSPAPKRLGEKPAHPSSNPALLPASPSFDNSKHAAGTHRQAQARAGAQTSECNDDGDQTGEVGRLFNITVAVGSYFDVTDYLKFHVKEYERLHPNVNVQLQQVSGSIADFQNFLSENTDQWDAAILPSQSIGSLVEAGALLDLSHHVGAPAALPASGTPAGQTDGTALPSVQSSLDWPDYLPYIKNHIAMYDRKTYLLPLDGDTLQLFYRPDLFARYNLTVPRTWEEYSQTAKFFSGLSIQTDSSVTDNSQQPVYGSCMSRAGRCSNAYWMNLILASMTQTDGTSTGFLIDPYDESVQPLMGPAMRQTLRFLQEHVMYGHPQEASDDASCLATNFLFNQGECAMTINWGDQLRGLQRARFPVAIASTPGSTHFYNRSTKKLQRCTVEICPYAKHYVDDDTFVNRAPYAAFGGWSASVSSDLSAVAAQASNTNRTNQRQRVLDFLGFISNPRQSIQDVLPNSRSNFMQPFRYSHLGIQDDHATYSDILVPPPPKSGSVDNDSSSSPNPWVSQAGYDEHFIKEYVNAILEVSSSPNLAMELRTPQALALRGVLDTEVTNFIDFIRQSINDNLPIDEATELQLYENVTQRLENRVREVIFTLDQQQPPVAASFLQSYQKSLGLPVQQASSFMSQQQQYPNTIMSSFRFAGWGLTGLICGAAILCSFIALFASNHRVIRAWQSFTLVQCCIGFFLMGGTIALLSLDETNTNANTDLLDVSCMAIPWVYVMGFTMVLSAIYAKIIRCREIRTKIMLGSGKAVGSATIATKASVRTPSTITVDWEATFRFTLRIFLVNAILLTIWTVTDPLQWVREEVDDNGKHQEGDMREVNMDTYGTCRGEFYTSYIFMAMLFIFNICLCTAGIVQAFQSRRLAFEFKENHWLPLILFPFVECWVIGAPTLFLVNEDPNGRFVVMTCIITVSCMGALLCLFAPIEWYIRKYESELTSTSTKALSKTSYSKEQELRDYQLKIQLVADDNGRLQSEISELRNKFREEDDDSVEKPKAGAQSRSLMEFMSTPLKPDKSDPCAIDDGRLVMQDVDDEDDKADHTRRHSHSSNKNDAAESQIGGEHGKYSEAERAEDEDVAPDRPESHPMNLSSTEPLVVGTPKRTLNALANLGDSAFSVYEDFPSPGRTPPRYDGRISPAAVNQKISVQEESSQTVEESHSRGLTPAFAQMQDDTVDHNELVESRKDDNGSINDDARFSDQNGSSTSSDTEEDIEGGNERNEHPKNDYSMLETALQSNNFGAIGSTVSLLAAAIKTRISYKTAPQIPLDENCDDHDGDGDDKSDDGYVKKLASTADDDDASSKDTRPTATDQSDAPVTDEDSRSDSMLLGDFDDEEEAPRSFKDQSTTGESSAAEAIHDDGEASRASASDDQSTASPITTQNAGEPSGGDVQPTPASAHKISIANGLEGFHEYRGGKAPPMAADADLSQRKISSFDPDDIRAVQPSPQATAEKQHSFSVGDWSAVGAMASVLADSSDSQSCSSFGSYATETSASSMGATRAASELDNPLAKELDALVGNKDWDGVKRAAAKFEASRISAVEHRRRKKRNLEALRHKYK